MNREKLKGRRAVFAWVQSLDSFFRQARLRYLGLGLLIAWVYGSWFSNGIFTPDSARGVDTLRISLAASAVGLLVLAFRPRRRAPLAPGFILAASAVVSATTLLFFVAPDGLPLLFASAVGGLASAVLWIAWGELFCQVDLEVTEASIPSSLAVFVAAVLLIYLIPAPVSGIVAALLPLASSLMLLLCKNDQPEGFAFPEPIEPFSGVLPSLVKLAFCSMVCSIATGCVVTSASPESLVALGMDDRGILFYIAGGVVAGLIAVFAIAHTSRMSFSFLYEWAIPLVVFSLSLRALDDPVCNVLASVLACAAALYVEVLFFAIFARITAKGFCLPSETFGIFRAMVQLGFLAGAMLGASVSPRFGLPLYLALVCLCVVMLPLFLHLQKRFESPGMLGVAGALGPVAAEIGAEARSGSEVPSREGLAGSVLAQEAGKGVYAAPIAEPVDYVAAMAEAFKLSPRETEVLRYLGRGRSVPYMREVMTLSKSTIETHIKHIYAKTDVHSKQELIDLIESYQEGTGEAAPVSAS